MSINFKIIPLKKSDAQGIENIEKACFAHPWSQKAIEASFDNNTVFLGALCNNEIVGYCGIQTVCDEGYVTNIAVLDNYRKNGIGKALVDGLVCIAKEQALSFLTLEVRVSNKNAISLYKKSGFENMGTRKNFYRDPKEDAYIMTRQM